MKKKVLSVFLAMLRMLAIVPAAAFADGNVAQVVGGDSYATLADAFDACPADGIVKLISDYTVGNDYVVKNLTLDLNGYTITSCVGDDINGIAVLNATLTVVDNSTAKTGKIDCTAGYALAAEGSNTINLNGGHLHPVLGALFATTEAVLH